MVSRKLSNWKYGIGQKSEALCELYQEGLLPILLVQIADKLLGVRGFLRDIPVSWLFWLVGSKHA
jgi:hypothetical protein